MWTETSKHTISTSLTADWNEEERKEEKNDSTLTGLRSAPTQLYGTRAKQMFELSKQQFDRAANRTTHLLPYAENSFAKVSFLFSFFFFSKLTYCLWCKWIVPAKRIETKSPDIIFVLARNNMLLNSLTQWSLWWSCNFGATNKRNQINAILWFCLFFAITFQLYAKLIRVSVAFEKWIRHSKLSLKCTHFLFFVIFVFGQLSAAVFASLEYCSLQMEVVDSVHMECDILCRGHHLLVHLSKILFGR